MSWTPQVRKFMIMKRIKYWQVLSFCSILLGWFSNLVMAQGLETARLVFVSSTDSTTEIKSLLLTSGGEQSIYLKNIGKKVSDDLTKATLTIADDTQGAFAQNHDCLVKPLDVQEWCTITITFTPKDASVSKATLKLEFPKGFLPKPPMVLNLEGQGTTAPPVETPNLSVFPTTLNFDSSITTGSVTVSNTGQGTLSVSSIALTGVNASDFSHSGCENASLAANGNCNLTVTFTVPNDDTVRTASLKITSNGGQATVALSGRKTATPPVGATLPDLGQVFAFDTAGQAVNTTAKFEGGISVNGGEFKTSAELNLADQVILNGVITPDPSHNAQTADIIVVGLYVPEDKLGTDNCDPEFGDYYMMQRIPDLYCKEDKSYCKSERSKPETSEDYSQVWIKLWDGNLQKLETLYQNISLAEPIKLTAEGKSQGLGPMYEGRFEAKGHLCINVGYRLLNGTLVFNGKTIDVMIK